MKATAPVLIVAILPAAAQAIGLGEAVLRSPLGQPLDARIQLITQGEAVSGDCFSVVGPSAGGIASTEGIDLTVERAGPRLELRASTRQPLREPYVAFTIRASCPGQHAGALEKSYALLPDPPGAEQPVPALAAPASEERPTRTRPAAAPVRVRENARATGSPRRGTSPAFTLRLSTSTTMAGPARAGWRERQRDIEADDRTAEILQLKRTVELLDARMASLQLKLAQATQLQAAPAAPPPVVAAVPAAPSGDARWTLPILLSALLGAAAGYFGARRAARREHAAREPVAPPAASSLHRLYGIETGQWVALPRESAATPRAAQASSGAPNAKKAPTAKIATEAM